MILPARDARMSAPAGSAARLLDLVCLDRGLMGGEEAFKNALIQGTAKYRHGTCSLAQVSFVITLFEP